MKNLTMEQLMETAKPKSFALRLAAYFCSALALLNPITPAVANMLDDVTIERDLNQNPVYLKSADSSYQFNAPQFIEWPSSGTTSLESVYHQLLREHSVAISPPKYIPIGVGGITTFIPTYARYKYVGTPAVQARYVRTQIAALLGRNIFKYSTEAEQLNALYTEAVVYAKQSGHRYGAPLGWDQASGERDMIWPELRKVNGQQVIVPVVYLTATTVEQYKVVDTQQQIPKSTEFGSLKIYNSNLKAERNTFLNVAGDLRLSNASLTSDGALKITAVGAFDNASSVVEARGSLEIGAKSIHNRTIVYRYDLGHEQGSRYGEIASIRSIGDKVEGQSGIPTKGDVILKSHSDIQFNGANATAQNGALTLAANGHILIGTQQLYSGSTSRYGNGTQTRSQVSFLQSHLTAEDTIKLIASGQIVLDAAEIVSDSGHIELLSGMGVSIIDATGVTQSQAKGKFGKTKVEESAYVTVAMRAVLDAGKGIRIHSDVGDITLKAADITSGEGTSISANAGQVNLLVSTVNDHYNYQSVRKGSVTVKTRSRGHSISTGIPNSIVGGLAVEAVAGLNVEYTGDSNKSFEEQINDFRKMPELSWLADLKDRDDLDVDWKKVEEQYETWSESNTSLSPAAIAVIAIVVTVATGGAAAALGQAAAAGLTGTAATTVSAAVAAGATAMATQVAVITANSFVNGEFNPYEIQKDIHTEETLATVATAMVTAAALSYLDAAFFEDLDVDALAKQQGVDPSAIDTGWLRDSAGKLNFVGQAAQATTNAAVSSALQVLATEGDWGDFEDTFKSALFTSAVNTLGESVASDIGELSRRTDGTQISTLSKYLMHAGLGCATGYALTGLQSGNSSEGCLTGAAGGVIGEASELLKDPLAQEFDNWLDDYLSTGGAVDQELINSQINSFVMRGVDMSRVLAGLVAFIAGHDVNIAAQSAQTAALYNATSSFAVELNDRAQKKIFTYRDPKTGALRITDGTSPSDRGNLGLGTPGEELDATEKERQRQAEVFAEYYKTKLLCELGKVQSHLCSITAYDLALPPEVQMELSQGFSEGSPGQLQLKKLAQLLSSFGDASLDLASSTLEVGCESIGTICGVSLLTYRYHDGEDIGWLETVLAVAPLLPSSSKSIVTSQTQEIFEDAVAIPAKGSDAALDVFHLTTRPGTPTSPSAAESILNGIDPKYLNPDSRFGSAFYVAERPATSVAELAHYGYSSVHGIRFELDMTKAKVLDLTDPEMAKSWGYSGGPISADTKQIGKYAREQGYTVIRYFSERDSGGINNAILGDFDNLLKPVMVTPGAP